MKCHFEKRCFSVLPDKKGFSLTEAVAALVILGLLCSGVLVTINRCMASAAQEVLRMHAFEVARENMEKLLSLDSVPQMVEYGDSERYPAVKWQTTVEVFYEPVNSRVWLKAVCSAEYIDNEGEPQKVEFTHWLSGLSQEDIAKILNQKEGENNLLFDYIIGTIEEAAEYAGVDVETIEQWEENGMPLTDEGYYTKGMLDLYEQTNGEPTDEQIMAQKQEDEEILEDWKQKGPGLKKDPESPEEQPQENYDNIPFCDRPIESIKTKEDFERWVDECLKGLFGNK
jgi:type II secretory pathway pseudopilin PulG